MSRLVTLAEVRLRGLRAAGHAFDDVIETEEANDIINQAFAEFHEMVGAAGLGYIPESTDTISTDGSVSYRLPDDFWRMVAIERSLTSTRYGRPLPELSPVDDTLYPTIGGSYAQGYRIDGSNPAYLVLLPTPISGLVYRVRYFAAARTLSDDTDEMDGVNGWDKWCSNALTIYVLARERSDFSLWANEQQATRERIEDRKMQRTMYTPMTVRDVQSEEWAMFNPHFNEDIW